MARILEMNNTAHVAPPLARATKEEFDRLVFFKDGSLSIQTTVAQYFFANAYFYAAIDLSNLIQGNATKHLNNGDADGLITDREDNEYRFTIKIDVIENVIVADKITSNWPGVVDFMTLFQKIYNSK